MIIVTDALEHYENVTECGHRCIETAGIWATYPQDHVSNVTGFFDQVFITMHYNRTVCNHQLS